ncbi:MAG TPA: hypothetical protein VGI39_21050 [Polyangiaceae bacterium]|jgi:hypothetical protein
MSHVFRERLVFGFRIFLVAFFFVAMFRGPQIVWLLLPPRWADVVIVDKTMSHENYREHSGLTWLLTAMKVMRPGGLEYDETRDYVGFDPRAHVGHDLAAKDLEKADILFFADTYGVYKADYLAIDDPNVLERSRKLYGGLTLAEATAASDFVERGGTVIGEFNTFASPTEDAPRAKMEELLGAHWSHWVGRYWKDLSDVTEVPGWLKRDHQRIFGRPLDATGAALIFVLEDHDMVVLRTGQELAGDSLRIERVADDKDPERAKLPEAARYGYWFDVVQAGDADVLYEYVVPTIGDADKILFKHGLNARFPAVLRHRRTKGSAWYFAGDFIDTSAERGDPHRAGLLWWRKITMGDLDAPEGIFWGWYAPLLSRLIEPRVHPGRR